MPTELSVERADMSVDLSERHPEVQRLYEYFSYKHLRPRLQDIARHYNWAALRVIHMLPDSPELTVCLRKLLESKDCAVRAALTALEEPEATDTDS